MSPRSADRARLAFALAFSLLLHGLILSLRFGAPGFGLPVLAFPWAERRAPAMNLSVRLLEVPQSAASADPATPNDGLALKLSKELTDLPKGVAPSRPFEATIAQTEEVRAGPVSSQERADPGASPRSLPERETAATTAAVAEGAAESKIRAKPLPRILVQREPRSETFNVPPPEVSPSEPPATPESAARVQSEDTAAGEIAAETLRKQAEQQARLEAEEAARERSAYEARQRAEEDARQRALALEKELEARRLAEERSRREAEELARQRAVALEKEREAQRAEELARQQAIAREKELVAKRQAEEAATRAKELGERERVEKEAAARRERERLASRAPDAAPQKPLSGTELAARALEQFRRPGVERTDPSRAPSRAAAPETPRRRSVFGVEREVSLRMYADGWRWKIERGGASNYRASAAWRARENPIVTVSIRSDGSLEDVLILRSSGVQEIDDAIRRIAQLHAPYSKFPPEIARLYDVIEIRRVWMFDRTLRIVEEM
jgi:outer membrane biosynthesis protein TonB